MENKAYCLNCEKELVGRFGKKFCDAQCRNAYHNQHKRPDEKQMQGVNAHLRQNRRILKGLSPEGKATVRRDVLEAMGFDFGLFTSLFSTQKGVYYFSYEYGFMPIEEKSLNSGESIQKVLIIQRQDFMNQPFDPWKYLK